MDENLSLNNSVVEIISPYGVDIANNLLYDINEGTIQLSFEKQLYGYSTIRDVESGLYLEAQDNGCVTFSSKSESERQLWLVYTDDDNLYLFNIYTGKYLKYVENEDGSIQVILHEDETNPNYKDIIFKNYPIIQEDIEYLIIPKNDFDKALLINDTVQSTSYPIILGDIDFSNNKQRFIFEFSNEDNGYRIKSNVYDNLSFYAGTQSLIMNTRETLFYIIQTADGYYKLGYKNKMISYIEGAIKTTYNKVENDDDQKFMFIPVTDVITDATYQILVDDDETKALSVNNSMVDGSEITIETANSSDISQRFYVYNFNGSYKLISLYSGKTISLSEDFDSIVQSQISESDTLQNWQVINSVADDSDYSIKLVSYRTGDYLQYNNNALSTSYYSGESDQLFTLKRVTRNTISSTGEIISVSDATKDISINESVAVLSDISTNGRTTLRLSPDENGVWTIEDIASETVLTETNNVLMFEVNTSSNSQKWIMKSLSDDTFILLNLNSGMALTNNNGTLSLNVYTGEQNQKFDVYNKGDINHDGRISSRDLMLIKQYVTNEVQFSDVQRYCADYNDDGRINAKDVNLLKQFLGVASTSSNEQSAESELTSISTNSIMTRNSLTRGELTDADIIEMTDEEFLTWLFGDVDYDSLSVTIFE